MAEPTSVQDETLSKLDAAAAPSAPVPDEELVKNKLDELTTAGGQKQQGNEDSDSEGEDGDGDQVNGASSASGAAAKKKKKKKSKKKKGGAAGNGAVAGPAMQQTDPPSIGLTKLYPNGNFPVGEVSEYTGE